MFSFYVMFMSKLNIVFLEELTGSTNAAGGYVFGRCSLEEYTFHIAWISGLFYHLQLVTFCFKTFLFPDSFLFWLANTQSDGISGTSVVSDICDSFCH